jgi:phosphoglycolate phosphatase-like HAD superfamily hydrolase
MMLNNYQLIIFDWEGTLFDPASQSLYPNTEYVLKHLKQLGKTIAICSNACKSSIQQKLSGLNIMYLLDFFSCATTAMQKPNPGMVACLLQDAALQAKHAVLIGDSMTDQALATKSGIDFIGIHHHSSCPCHQKSPHIHQIIQLIDT